MSADASLDLVLAVLSGLGLAAACGFRVFVPLLVLSAAAAAGRVELGEGFAWIGSTPALVCFAVATALELTAYYVPVVDNLLDAVATPAAAVAGALVAMSVLVDVDPWLRWTLGVIGGAGLATAVQVPTAALRGGSTATTAGLGNAGVATGEVVSASVVSGMAVFAPIAIPIVLIALVAAAVQWRRRNAARRRRRAT